MAAAATAQQAERILEDESLAEEKLLEELENEEIPASIQDARLAALKQQAREFQLFKEKGHGQFSDLIEEKSFLDLVTNEDICVVHFYHSDFRRCAIMDTHLQKLAEKYFEVKFAKINVENATFFVKKLKIVVLPTVTCFKKGHVVDKIVGFEALGNTDDFQTVILERRLAKAGIINQSDDNIGTGRKTIFGRPSAGRKDSESDDD